MYFEALPVAIGDAFLLVDGDFRVVIDGGEETDIVSLIEAKAFKDKHFDIMICTHYDTDHINGLLDLLKGKYTFDQIWLPEPIGSIANTVVKSLKDLDLYYVEQANRKKSEPTEIVPSYVTIEYANEDHDSTESIDLELLESLQPMYSSWHPLFRAWLPHELKLSVALNKICFLTSKSIRSGAQIRWFRYLGTENHQDLGSGFSTLNCQQVQIATYKPSVFDLMLSLTASNKHSLVFQFHKDSLPDVLFTADSDLAFIKGTIPLRAQSIVTAPHHGSKDNDTAYGKICGEDLIFVRSDRSQTSRPGEGFLKQTRRYCTICRNKGPKQQIEIELTNGASKVLSGSPCHC